MRMYVVRLPGGVAVGERAERLVMANSPSQAVMHVARDMIEVHAAKALDVARVMESGGRVETIGGADDASTETV